MVVILPFLQQPCRFISYSWNPGNKWWLPVDGTVTADTMTGFGQAGIIGAAVATLGVILPSFLIMLVIPRLQKKWSGHRVIRLAMRGIKPCLAGVICATGIHLAIELLSAQNADVGFDALALVLLCILGLFSFGWKKYRRKPVSPIVLIMVAAVLGMCVF